MHRVRSTRRLPYALLLFSVYVPLFWTATWAQTPSCVESAPVGLVGYVHTVGGQPIGLDVQHNYAYVGDWASPDTGSGVLQIIDVSDPCNPAVTWSTPTDDPGPNEIGDVGVRGNYAYVANDANGFAIYDVTDPTNAFRVEYRQDGTFAHSVHLAVLANAHLYAFVGYLYSGGLIAMYDVSSLPLSPPAVYYAPNAFQVFDAYVVGNRAYLLTDSIDTAESGFILHILDITNLSSMQSRGSVFLPQPTYGSIGELRVSGNYAYLALSDHDSHIGGIRVIDLSNEAHPQVVASYDLPVGHIPWKGTGIEVVGEKAYVAAKDYLYVFDISAPRHPVLETQFATSAAFGPTLGGHVVVKGNLAYVTAYGEADGVNTGGLAIFKLFDPFTPLTAQATLSVRPQAADDTFDLQAAFLLGDGSNGINPLTEAVTLQVGTTVLTIPAEAFQRTAEGGFAYTGVVEGATLQVTITLLTRATFEIVARGEGATLTGIAVPVEVGLTIGDDRGSTTLPVAEVSARTPPPQRESIPKQER